MERDSYTVDGGDGTATVDVLDDRQQYISKIPSSSFLRVPVDSSNQKLATDAEFSVQEVSSIERLSLNNYRQGESGQHPYM